MASAAPLLVLTTVSKKTDANKISKTLLASKLAACVTTLPRGESRYIWQGKVCVEKEYVLLIKTLNTCYDRLEKTLKKIHPYDCPEILGINTSKINLPYRDWLQENVKK